MEDRASQGENQGVEEGARGRVWGSCITSCKSPGAHNALGPSPTGDLPWLSLKLQGEGGAKLKYANTLTGEAGLQMSQHSSYLGSTHHSRPDRHFWKLYPYQPT